MNLPMTDRLCSGAIAIGFLLMLLAWTRYLSKEGKSTLFANPFERRNYRPVWTLRSSFSGNGFGLHVFGSCLAAVGVVGEIATWISHHAR